jgi:hypothetical protein
MNPSIASWPGRVGCLSLVVVLLASCGEAPAAESAPEPVAKKRGGSAPGPAAAGAAGAAGAATPAAAADATDKEPLVLSDDDFVESLHNRDPFRAYSMAMKAKAPDEMQRLVVMPTTDIEEMTLIAIITGMPRPKAMLVDASQVGFVVERGDFVGRPKIVQAAGSVSMALNWRVDRIRENEVVLTQQDPTDPTRPGLTKIIPLNIEGAEK